MLANRLINVKSFLNKGESCEISEFYYKRLSTHLKKRKKEKDTKYYAVHVLLNLYFFNSIFRVFSMNKNLLNFL